MNIKKSVVYLYTNNKQLTKENNPIYNSIHSDNYLENNLTKDMKNLYTENYDFDKNKRHK